MAATVEEREYTTYPRRFAGYKWYKPLLVGVLFVVFFLLFQLAIELVMDVALGGSANQSGYDDMDFFSTAGAFENGARAVVFIPALLFAARIVNDRPISSYFSSMGGWRWDVFLKTLAAAFVILGIPTIVSILVKGQTGVFSFTVGGFVLLLFFVPLQGFAEELSCRGYLMQTVSSWFMLPAVGVIAQMLVFTAVHPYNSIGMVEIAVSGLLYALVCICTKGIESSSALHIVNNATEIFMAGFGFGLITSEQTIPSVALNLALKVLFFLFILYAHKKLHWFDIPKRDDVAAFNSAATVHAKQAQG